MDVRTSIETGKPMLLGLGTAEKNSGLVIKPRKFESDVPISVFITCPTAVTNRESKGLDGKKILWAIKNVGIITCSRS